MDLRFDAYAHNYIITFSIYSLSSVPLYVNYINTRLVVYKVEAFSNPNSIYFIAGKVELYDQSSNTVSDENITNFNTFIGLSGFYLYDASFFTFDTNFRSTGMILNS